MQITEDPSISMIVGNSPQILDLKAAVLKVAPRNTTVLITGETGTGKELFAQAIHQGGLRRFKPFVRVNCAAIPEALLESELFGYAEGTFTGGKRGGYIGKFAQADGGTVFLDEVAELPISLQAKLLRFLQEREIQRLGESYPRRVNVRIVAATNANLLQLVKYKKFRSDLYYRLNVVALDIPPLRDRREDLKPLCQIFMKRLNSEFDYRVYRLNEEVNRIFNLYPWYGNVRELANVLEVAFNLCDGEQELTLEHLPVYLRRWYKEQLQKEPIEEDNNKLTDLPKSEIGKSNPNEGVDSVGKNGEHPEPSPNDHGQSPEEFHNWQNYLNSLGQHPLSSIVDRLEGDLLRYLLGREQSRTNVASLLGISRPALYKKMHKHSLS